MNLKKKLDDKGASLVLVIVCMLFVGIIASIVLTMTVGNTKAVTTSKETSRNFYTAEDFVDDFKTYLTKFANQAATQAYADVLSQIAVDGAVDMEALYQEKFSEHLNDLLVDDGHLYDISKVTFGNFADPEDDADPINGKKYGIVTDAAKAKGFKGKVYIKVNGSFDQATKSLSNVTFSFYDDENNYETTINTSFVFNTELPKLEWSGAEKEFGYNLDKYLAVSNGNIKTNRVLKGTMNGNLYAKNDIDMWISASATGPDTLNLNSTNVICGGQFSVMNGNLAFAKLGPLYADWAVNNSGVRAVISDDSNANIWANNFIVDRQGRVNITDGHMYLEDDLSLEGDTPKFTMSGTLLGFSASNAAAGNVTAHANSSAIILNGLGAELDLTGVTDLTLAGTAYTQVPAIAGQTAEPLCSYFVQGESVTYRSLQALYLIPGEYLNGVYHNPMTVDEYNAWAARTDKFVDGKTKPSYIVSGNEYLTAEVKYINSSTAMSYKYLYWNFQNDSAAVKYFNTLYNTENASIFTPSGNTPEGQRLIDKIGMLRASDKGFVKLPSAAAIHTKGNLIIYDPSATEKIRVVKGNGANAEKCNNAKDAYVKLKSTLSTSEGMKGTDLFNTIFRLGSSMVGIDIAAGEKTIYPLVSPTKKNAYIRGWSKNGDGSDVKGSEPETYEYVGSRTNAAGTMETALGSDTGINYWLITGSNLVINPEDLQQDGMTSNDKFIVVSTGNVTMNVTKFNGMIIAKGDIYLDESTDGYNCLGNYVRQKEGESEEYITEFAALLDRPVFNDSEYYYNASGNKVVNGNTLLRKIFDVASTTGSKNGSDKTAGDLVNIGTANWSVNSPEPTAEPEPDEP